MKFTPKEPSAENPNVVAEHPLKEFAWLVLVSSVLVVGVFFVLGWAAERLIVKMPVAWEKRLLPFSKLFGEDPKLSDANAYLSEIVTRLASHEPDKRYEFKVLTYCSKSPNAFALPGGTIAVASSLLEKIKSENGLAFVLGHEIGHFKHRHQLLGLGRALVLVGISSVLLGESSGTVTRIAGYLINLSELKFSRAQEEQSDAVAGDLLVATYGHGSGASEFFSSLKEEEGSSSLTEFFSTHPNHDHRITAIEKQIGDRKGALTPLRKVSTDCKAK